MFIVLHHSSIAAGTLTGVTARIVIVCRRLWPYVHRGAATDFGHVTAAEDVAENLGVALEIDGGVAVNGTCITATKDTAINHTVVIKS